MSVPTDFANLGFWYKADAGVYKDAGTTLAANGDTVQQWNDQSGNGKHATQATAGSRPTYVTGVQNGLGCVRFSAHFMNIGRGANKLYTCFVVCKRANTTTANQAILSDTINGANHGVYAQRGGTNPGRLGTWDSVNTWSQGGVMSHTIYDIYTWRRDDTAGQRHVDFFVAEDLYSTITLGSAVPNVGTAFWLGQGTSGGERLAGDLCEVIYYDAYLSDSDCASLQQYLQARWACDAVLKIKLLSDTGVYNDAGSTPATNGQTVQQWNDQSGNGLNMSQATSARRPVFATAQVNGYPAVQFRDASDQWMQELTLGSPVCYTAFGVVKRISTTITSTWFSGVDSGGTSRDGVTLERTDGNGSTFAPFDSGGSYNGSVLPDSTWEVVAAVIDRTARRIKTFVGIAADLNTTTGSNQPIVSDRITLAAEGNGAANSHMNGDMAELWLYDGRFTNAQILAKLAELSGKYNLHQPVRVYTTFIG